MEYLGDGPVQKLIFMDTWYSMRQIEQITANYPEYAWFDPMTAYPTGKDVDWGPLFPFLCATLCVLLGAVTRPENMVMASYVPPLLFLILVPVMWYLGKLTGGERTGWIAAIIVPIITGELLYRSFFGYLDHHLTETLFSTLFITLLLALILTIQKEKTIIYSTKSLILAGSAGFAYFLGIMNIPTMVLFLGIGAIILFIHAIYVRNYKELSSLFIHLCLFWLVFSLFFLFLGINFDGLSVHRYTIVHIFIAMVLPVLVGIFGLISYVCDQKPVKYFYGGVIGTIIGGYAVFVMGFPSIHDQFVNYLKTFFLFPYADSFINEMQMWEPVRAWYSYNIALILAFLGILICLIQLFRSYHPVRMGVLVWGLIILFATIMHLRYEYYASVVIVLFAAITLSTLYTKITEYEQPLSRSKKDTEKKHPLSIRAMSVVSILIILIGVLSAQTIFIITDTQIGQISISNDWADSLLWLSDNSPEPGIMYDKIYEKANFTYPVESYGILSWWDYGHWITFLSKRIPITSPFQDNVPPVAKFLSAQSEEDANTHAAEVGARYVITDYATVTLKFAALPLWAYGKDSISSYQETYYQQSPESGRYDPILVLKQPYFMSTASRLHLFDGSYTSGSGGTLLTIDQSPLNDGIPVITSAGEISAHDAQNLAPSSQRLAGSIQFTKPITDVPALGHYRLIYESPTTVASDDVRQIKEVKIFERVNGYTLPGTGTIELPLTSNQGRNYTWQQKSSNGSFTLPYSTQNNPYEVRATGPYRIIETGKTVEVSEDQIT
ncbi:oligosaccharyl transferase, archaeosortase A system-associated [Methanospirillum purgamenti]|nr:oligosaccharyl transferase, archaeosortase A system-associated [Methanospirillum hungatei]